MASLSIEEGSNSNFGAAAANPSLQGAAGAFAGAGAGPSSIETGDHSLFDVAVQDYEH